MDTRLKQNIYCKQEMRGATTTPTISAHRNQWYYPMRRDRVTTTTYELRESMSLARWPHLAKEIRVSDDTEIYKQPRWPYLAIEINGSWCEYIQIDIDICICIYTTWLKRHWDYIHGRNPILSRRAPGRWRSMILDCGSNILIHTRRYNIYMETLGVDGM